MSASFGLCLIQVAVRRADDIPHVLPGLRQIRTVADAADDIDPVLFLRAEVPEVLEPFPEGRPVLSLRDDEELVPAIAVAVILLPAKDPVQVPAHPLQHLIPVGMAVGVVVLLEEVKINERCADLLVLKLREVPPKRGPVCDVGQLVGAAVLIELFLLLLDEHPLLRLMHKALQTQPVDERTDEVQRCDIHHVLPGDRVVRYGKHHRGGGKVQDHVPAEGGHPSIRDQIDDAGHQDIFKEKAAVLLGRKEGGGGKDHVDAGKPGKQTALLLCGEALRVQSDILNGAEKIQVGDKDRHIDRCRTDGRDDGPRRIGRIGPDKPDEGQDAQHRGSQHAEQGVVGAERCKQRLVPL